MLTSRTPDPAGTRARAGRAESRGAREAAARRSRPSACGWPRCSGGLSSRGSTVSPVDSLQDGPVFKFADWPSDQVPRRAAGVYTIWRQDEFIYVGMSGRGAQSEDFVAGSGRPGKAMGLWTRLNSHASGRRSGDQFNLYICDRFIIPGLTPDQLRDLGGGHLLLDQLTRNYIRERLTYRFQVCRDGAAAYAMERVVRAGRLPAGRPYLNPL
jgi:hypothetical protein